MFMSLTRVLRYWPSLLAFALIAIGTVIWVNLDSESAESLDRLPTVVVTTRLEEGTDRADLISVVELRDLEVAARPQGALSRIDDIPDGVLVAALVTGQPVLESSLAVNRVASLGEGYVAISLRVDPQRWVGPVLLTGRTVEIYDINPDINANTSSDINPNFNPDGSPSANLDLGPVGPRLISSQAVIVDAVSPTNLTPNQDTVLSIGVRETDIAAVLIAASENRIWLVGR